MMLWVNRDCVRSAGRRGSGPKRLSDFASDFVKYGCALLGIVAASAKREALYLAGYSDLSLHGVLGVECSNHSVPTILFNDLAQSEKVGLFHARKNTPTFTSTEFSTICRDAASF